MDRNKFSAIAHRDHDYCIPASAAKIERLLDLLPLDAGSRVLDLGCGRAELSLRIIERFGSMAIAIDNRSPMLDAARERAGWTGALGKLHLDRADITQFVADPETFHLSAVLGAGGLDGDIAATLRKLRNWTTPGGYVLAGHGYWRRRPHSKYLAVLGAERDYLDHAGNVRAGIAAGLVPVHAMATSEDEWDEYQWRYSRSIERYGREQPDDPDVPQMLDRSRQLSDAYLRWGRDTLGFGIYLYYRPGPDVG